MTNEAPLSSAAAYLPRGWRVALLPPFAFLARITRLGDANTMQPLTYSTRNLYAKIAASMYHGHGGFAEFVLDIS